MPTLTFTYDTGPVPISRIVDAFASEYDYQATVTLANGSTGPNPESKAAFARRMIGEVIKGVVVSAERRAARAQADAGIAPPPLT